MTAAKKRAPEPPDPILQLAAELQGGGAASRAASGALQKAIETAEKEGATERELLAQKEEHVRNAIRYPTADLHRRLLRECVETLQLVSLRRAMADDKVMQLRAKLEAGETRERLRQLDALHATATAPPDLPALEKAFRGAAALVAGAVLGALDGDRERQVAADDLKRALKSLDLPAAEIRVTVTNPVQIAQLWRDALTRAGLGERLRCLGLKG